MPQIIDYSQVAARMIENGLRCNYPNSGSFGFDPAAQADVRGWIHVPDSTIKPHLAAKAQVVADLPQAAARIWREAQPGPVWIMPASHWHFELHDGSKDWLARALAEIAIDPKALEVRADGSAIQFMMEETAPFMRLLGALLNNLRVSDFTLAFPGRPVLCLVHHHCQLWWTTTDRALLARLDPAAR